MGLVFATCGLKGAPTGAASNHEAGGKERQDQTSQHLVYPADMFELILQDADKRNFKLHFKDPELSLCCYLHRPPK